MSEAINTNSAQGSYPTGSGGRPSKVAVIGAGAVGSTLAYACVTKGVAREVVLQDIVKDKVEAEALDIAQGIQFTSAGSVSGSDDPEICRDADVIAITAGAKQKPGQSRLELAGATVGIMEKILPKLVEVAPNAIFLLVANPVDVVTYCSRKITGLPENQVFGSGTVLDTARMRYLVSLETGTATQNIHGYIAGEHGDSEVALWSSTEIGGVPITQWGRTLDGGVFDQDKRDRITHDVVRSAYRIIEGKGVTNYAVGLAV
ncbi:NAD(P)-binding domain-containing protein, partial [uncultured Actinomyces sp.]